MFFCSCFLRGCFRGFCIVLLGFEFILDIWFELLRWEGIRFYVCFCVLWFFFFIGKRIIDICFLLFILGSGLAVFEGERCGDLGEFVGWR